MNEESLPKTRNPLGIFLFFLLTGGLYIFYWIPYILESLNHINGSTILDVSKTKNLMGTVFFTYTGGFILLLILGLFSNNRVVEVFLFVLFSLMMIIAASWIIGLITFFCFVNYQIDVMKESIFQEYTMPWLSTIIAFVLFVLYFLSVPFTQYKLNTLIKLHIKHNA